jgi:hypothetical protein
VPRVAAARDRLEGQHGYGILLALIATTAVYVVAVPNEEIWHFGTVVLQGAIAVLAVWSSGSRPGVVRGVCALVAVAVPLSFLSLVSDSNSLRDFSVLAALLAGLVPLIVVRGIIRDLRTQGVTERVIAGALCVYLLIGLLCAYIYGAIAEIASSPLFANGQGDGDPSDRTYFSFITQTTVGYGDFSPESPVARAVAMSQALTGQLYLVTVVSLLVGGYISSAQARRSSG